MCNLVIDLSTLRWQPSHGRGLSAPTSLRHPIRAITRATASIKVACRILYTPGMVFLFCERSSVTTCYPCQCCGLNECASTGRRSGVPDCARLRHCSAQQSLTSVASMSYRCYHLQVASAGKYDVHKCLPKGKLPLVRAAHPHLCCGPCQAHATLAANITCTW